MTVMTASTVEKVDTSGAKCKVTIKTKKGEETVDADIVLSAVGITSNLESIGLEEMGVKTEKGKIIVDDFYRTNVEEYMPLETLFTDPPWRMWLLQKELPVLKKLPGKILPQLITTTFRHVPTPGPKLRRWVSLKPKPKRQVMSSKWVNFPILQAERLTQQDKETVLSN